MSEPIKTKIPAEMEPAAVGGMVTDAKYIIDRIKNKNQTQVNAETEERVSTLEENVGTGSVDQKINAEKERAEGVEATHAQQIEDLQAMEQIVIDGGEAQIAQASDFDNPDATKRAKIPTVGAVLDGISEGVFNLTAKTGDSYASLQDALTAANTAIPANKKKGGMQLSFVQSSVQSSDNNYVQFRLMKDSWSTTVSDWQGVDNIPTAGSNNLVESGGAYEYSTNPLLLKTKQEGIGTCEVMASQYINPSNGSIGSSDAWTSYKRVIYGDVLHIEATVGADNQGSNAISFYSDTYNSPETYMGGIVIEAFASKTYKASIPVGCKCVVISNKTLSNSSPSVSFTVIDKTVLDNIFQSVNIKWSYGTINSNGQEDFSERHDRIKSGLIPITSIKKMVIDPNYIWAGYVYNSNMEFRGNLIENRYFNISISDLYIDGYVRFVVANYDYTTDIDIPTFNGFALVASLWDDTDKVAFPPIVKLSYIGSDSESIATLNIGDNFFNTSNNKVCAIINSDGGVIGSSAQDNTIYVYQNKIYLKQGNGLVDYIDAIDRLVSTLFETKTLTNFTAHYGKYIFPTEGDNQGILWTAPAWDTYTLEVSKDTLAKISFNVGSDNAGTYAIAYYSDTTINHSNFISGMTILAESSHTYDIDLSTVPDSCKLIAICNKNTVYNSPSATIMVRKASSGVPAGGEEGDVLTPSGWSSEYTTNSDVNTLLSPYATTESVNRLLSDYATIASINQLLNDYVKFTDYVSNISQGSVTVPTLSQAVLDLISAGGSGTIVNNPDDIDIDTNSNNQLQLKGGGVVRFRVKASASENYAELVRCIAAGLPIQIENTIDLANSDGSIRDITFNGETIVFVGNGKIKNCHITGNVYVQANKTQIFDNVYFHHWEVNDVSQMNGDSIYEMTLANTDYDVYNRNTKQLTAADVSTPINPFVCSLTANKIGSFVSPVLENGKYVYKENGNIVITFQADSQNNILLPIRKDFLFLNNGVAAESTYDMKTRSASYAYVPASNLTISRLYAPTRILDGSINGSIYPEWWGAKAGSSNDCKTAFQNAMLHGGDIHLSSDYYTSGDIRLYGNTKISGGRHSITLTAGDSSIAMFEIETLAGNSCQEGIYIYDLSLYGNMVNNPNGHQDGIYSDFFKGIYPFNSYSCDNTFWYNMVIMDFRGSGICVAVPGTSHIYSSTLRHNAVDGISWNNEHFTLVNVTSWFNYRHGAYANGNHWRIIGGAYAHNDGGDNIHCEGAFESQIIGCSCIDSGRFVEHAGGGYVASSLNVYGYIWAGEGQGTHALVGGNGINLSNCRNMTLIGVRINNQNANGILIANGSNINITSCQFNDNNMTKGLFKDINSNINTTWITSSLHDGYFDASNTIGVPVYFGDTISPADWNDILSTITDLHPNTYYVADYYNAANRPAGADAYLEGTIQVINGLSDTVARTYIRISDRDGNQYFRYCAIRYSDGVYVEDSGWKVTYSAS